MEEQMNQSNQHEPMSESQQIEEEEEEDVDIEEVAVAAYNRVDALVELLIKKGVITETEIDLMEDALVDDEEEETSNL